MGFFFGVKGNDVQTLRFYLAAFWSFDSTADSVPVINGGGLMLTNH